MLLGTQRYQVDQPIIARRQQMHGPQIIRLALVLPTFAP